MNRQLSVPTLGQKKNGASSSNGVMTSRRGSNNGELSTSLHAQRAQSPSSLAQSTGTPPPAKTSESSNDEEGEKRRKELLEQLQCLGNHLAGNVVDFLIEEVEKKILENYAKAAMGDETDGEDNDEESVQSGSEEGDEEEEFVLDDSMADLKSMADETETENNDFEDESEYEESLRDLKDNDDEDEEDEKLSSAPISSNRASRGGLGSLYGGGNNNRGNSLGGVGVGGLRQSATSSPPSSLGGSLYGGGAKPTSTLPKSLGNIANPRRNTVQVGYLQRSQQQTNNPSSFGGLRQSTKNTSDLIGGSDDEEDEEDDLIPSSFMKKTDNPPQKRLDTGFQRSGTLPEKLTTSPLPTSPKPTRSLSPGRKLGRHEKGAAASSFSPKRPGSRRQLMVSKSLDETTDNSNFAPKRPGSRRQLGASKSMDDTTDNSNFANKPSSPWNTPENARGIRTGPGKLNVSMFESPGGDRATRSPGGRGLGGRGFGGRSPGGRGLSRASPLAGMVKQGSVRNVMSMFEPKKPASSRPGMAMLREDSVKNIMESLAEDQNKIASNKDSGDEDDNDVATNPNEAPNSQLENSKNQGGLSITSARARAAPRLPSNDGSAEPKRGVQRNSSSKKMQRFLEKRSVDRTSSGLKGFMAKKGSGSSNRSTSPLSKPTLARKTSGQNAKRPVERTSSGGRKKGVERTSSGLRGGRRGGLSAQYSFDSAQGTSKSSSFGMFARDKVTNKLSNETRKQKRIFKTQNALRKLKKATENKSTPDSTEGSDSELEDSSYDLDNFVGSIAISLPCGVKHRCALLFVDISGFTALSTRLKVEKLSKTINAYFQLIVEHVQAFGGDILKFAGDAVFVEWRATRSSLLKTDPDDESDGMYGGEGLGDEKAVITAAACAARIIDKCTDYDVFDEDGEKVATLNLHCAIGFGEVVGVHLGTSDRMEYFIIGDPIKQVAVAMDLGKLGEVVASPECLKFLEGQAATEPKAILSKTNKFLNPKLMLVKPDKKRKIQGAGLADRLDDWDMLALKSLQKLMSPYVHPVVVENQVFQKSYGSVIISSEAEIRDVFTVFIQPMVDIEDTEVLQTLQTLHQVLVIVNNQLRIFKGQLRQYTVDDKGIVLIANFGLRGSTFPEMVERLAMPFAANVQQILKTKLSVDTVMGATYGKVYCGVVGGVERHEYAVLGPSVNLAARLMANKANKGFLVDEEVRRKASSRGFEGLAPVKAKGYKQLVPIFEPVLQHRRSWGSQGNNFVGRTSEIKQTLKLAEDVIDAVASTRMVWVSAESGYGKSALLAHATEKIQDLCSAKSATHIILCHVCSDSDSFQPLSVVGPLCLDILAYVRRQKDESRYKKPDGFSDIAGLAKPGSEHAPFQILGACRDAEVPDTYIRAICKLLLTHSWSTEVDDAARDKQIAELARYIVTILLQMTIHLDLVVWAVDDIPHADQLSWKVLELLHQYSCNFILLMASRPVAGKDMNIDAQFWEFLHGEGEKDGSFLRLELGAMTKDDLGLLVKKYATNKQWDASVDLQNITREVLVQSGGVPNIAAQILEKSSRLTGKPDGSRSPKPNGSKKKKLGANSLDRLNMNVFGRQQSFASLGSGSAHSGNASMAQMGEHMLHRMDLLSPEARTHLNLGAILGPAFESVDVVSVMERYRGIGENDKDGHREAVLASLAQAVESGILEEDITGAGNSMSFCAQENFLAQESITYKFTHDDWRRNILKVVLDSWKRDMYLLLAESLEARFDITSRRPDREIKKLFEPFKGGKKKGKNISVASELALKIGDKMTKKGKGRYSLRIYQRALDYWLKPDEGDNILMMEDEEDNDSTTDALAGEDLEYVLKLNAAMGRCSLLLMDKEKSTAAFQSSLDLVPDSKDLKDPAQLFPAFAGRFYTLRLTRKVDHEPETDFVYSFIEEAEAHKDPIHKLQGMAMEAEVFGRNGECDKALEASEELRTLYNAATHSSQLVEFYGDDYCAQCIAQSASWHLKLSQTSKAREVCEYIVSILPTLKGTDQFLALYPILWVLKDLPGNAGRALSLCHEYLPVNGGPKDSPLDAAAAADDTDEAGNFDLGQGDDDDDDKASDEEVEASFSPFKMLYKPTTILLDLLTQPSPETKTIQKYVDWVLKTKEFDKAFNAYTGSIGRNADSITAEICLELATCKAASSSKGALMTCASSLVASSMKLTKYMPAAYNQVKGFAYNKKYQGL